MGAGACGSASSSPEEARLCLEAIRGAGQCSAGGRRHGVGSRRGHDLADGELDAGTRGGRGILAKLFVVCQLRSMWAVAGAARPNSVISESSMSPTTSVVPRWWCISWRPRVAQRDGAFDEQAPLPRFGRRRCERHVGVGQRALVVEARLGGIRANAQPQPDRDHALRRARAANPARRSARAQCRRLRCAPRQSPLAGLRRRASFPRRGTARRRAIRSALSRAAPASRGDPRSCSRCSKCALRDRGLRDRRPPGRARGRRRTAAMAGAREALRIHLQPAGARRRRVRDAWRKVSVSVPARAPPADAVGAQSRRRRRGDSVVRALRGTDEIARRNPCRRRECPRAAQPTTRTRRARA